MNRPGVFPFLAALAAAGPAAAQPYNDGHMSWNDGWGHMVFGGGILMILFWGAVIALVVWLASAALRRAGVNGPSDRPSPLQILEERYARGEIDREDYEARRRDLLRDKE